MSRSWQITIPKAIGADTTEEEVIAAIWDVLQLASEASISLTVELYNRGGYAETPFAYAIPVAPQGTDLAFAGVTQAVCDAVCVSGVSLRGVRCKVKMRRPSKRERQAAAKAKEAAKKAKAPPQPAWK